MIQFDLAFPTLIHMSQHAIMESTAQPCIQKDQKIYNFGLYI